MEREALFLHLNQLETQMKVVQQEFEVIKEWTAKLVEENVSLQMENEQYKQLLEQDKESNPDFKENTLQSLYEEGFHVCSMNFGTHRHGEDCLFCHQFLNKD